MTLPLVKPGQTVRPHQPAEMVPRTAPPKLTQGVEGSRLTKSGLGRDHPDMAAMGNQMARAVQPGAKRRHLMAVLQRVLRADEPPDLVQAQLPPRHITQMQVTFMCRVEGSAEQADSKLPPVMKQAWHAVTPEMVRLSRREAGHGP